MLKEFNCSRNTVCPLPSHHKLFLSQGVHLENPKIFRRLVGKLIFLFNTIPDLAFLVQHLNQVMSDPRSPHLEAAINVPKYLNNNPNQGLLMNNNDAFSLRAYYDSNWTSCPQSRRSISRFIIFLGDSPVTWKFKKQITVSLSSAKVEYRSMRRVTAELAWPTRLLHEFNVPSLIHVPIHCDNLAAIHIARNIVFHERTKHVEIDCHFVREKLQDGLISLEHIPT